MLRKLLLHLFFHKTRRKIEFYETTASKLQEQILCKRVKGFKSSVFQMVSVKLVVGWGTKSPKEHLPFSIEQETLSMLLSTGCSQEKIFESELSHGLPLLPWLKLNDITQRFHLWWQPCRPTSWPQRSASCHLWAQGYYFWSSPLQFHYLPLSRRSVCTTFRKSLVQIVAC